MLTVEVNQQNQESQDRIEVGAGRACLENERIPGVQDGTGQGQQCADAKICGDGEEFETQRVCRQEMIWDSEEKLSAWRICGGRLWIVDVRPDGKPGLVFGYSIEVGSKRSEGVWIEAASGDMRVPKESPDIVIEEQEALPGIGIEQVLQGCVVAEPGGEERQPERERGNEYKSPGGNGPEIPSPD